MDDTSLSYMLQGLPSFLNDMRIDDDIASLRNRQAFMAPDRRNQTKAAKSYSHEYTGNARPSDVTRSCQSMPSMVVPMYSRKVFVGGLPADVSRPIVENLFSRFGRVVIDWPRPAQHPKERRTPRCSLNGYVFLVYEDDMSVHNLVNACTRDKGQLFLLVSSPTTKDKPAQVRPWILANIDYKAPDCLVKDGCVMIDPRKTVFVGGVPRPTTAEELARVLENEFGPVGYVGIDIDPDLKYPKGAARVAFKTTTAYLNAILGKFVRIPHVDSNKKEVEVKPYVLEHQPCDECGGAKCNGKWAPYFCGDVSCLQYYCTFCWDEVHYNQKIVPGTRNERAKHHPLVRINEQTKAMKVVPHLNPPIVDNVLSTLHPTSSLERDIDNILGTAYPAYSPRIGLSTNIPYSLRSQGVYGF